MRAALMLLVALPLFAQPSDLTPPPKPDPLPASARPSVERCEKAIAEARKAYEAACAKARIQTAKELDIAIKTETQKGNLDGALAIKAKVEEYKQDQVKPEAEKSKIVGRWAWPPGKVAVFLVDGTASQFRDGSKLGDGKWKEVKGTVEVRWVTPTGDIFEDSITLDGDTGKVFYKATGSRYEIKRLAD